MPDLNGREIFAVGKWNNIEFSEDDLDDIVNNFEKLSKIHKVPLKLGHNDEQKVTDGQPALGWVSRVYRQGKKLLADFSDVPKVIYDAILKKLYRSVSVELLFNVDNKGNKYDHVLDAVAILGADHPAVSTLADLDAFLASRADFSGGHRICFTVSEGKIPDKEEDDMGISDEDFKKLQASVDKLDKKLDEKDEELAKEKEEKAKLARENEELKRKEKEREEALKKEKIEASRKAVNDILNEAVNQKKMTPAIRETYSKQIGVDDDERVVSIDLEQVKLMCGAVKGKDDKESGKVDNENDDLGDKAPDEQLLTLARQFQTKHGEKSLEVAFSRVAEANPKLHRAYLDMNGEK